MRKRTREWGAKRWFKVAASAGTILVPGSNLSAQATPPNVVLSTPLSATQAVAVGSLVWPARVYVGQQATYEVGVFLSEEIRGRLRRNPEFVPPELRSILAHDLPMTTASQARVLDSVRFDVHVFRRALFPLTAGRHEIPPARLNYALPLSASFFSREEAHTLRTQSNTLVAVEPPAAGRPSDYTGAVGRLSLDARVDARRGRVGDPLLLTVAVSGVGNVSLLPRPTLALTWGDAVAGGERVTLDSAATLVRGRKEFDYLLTPRRQGAQSVPPMRYPYFNPYTEQYEVAVTRPQEVDVSPGVAVGAVVLTDSVPALPIRRAYRGDLPRPVSASAWYWWMLAAVPLLALLSARARRPTRQLQQPARDQVRELARRGVPADPTALRRAYANALRERLQLPAGVLSNQAALVRALRRSGVPSGVAHDAGRLLASLDAAVFAGESGPRGALPADAAVSAVAILEQVDRDALPVGESWGWARRSVTSVTGLLLSVTAVWAVADQASIRFAAGVSAYDAKEYAEAQRRFERVVAEHPRAADAWSNAGTAAWQQGDTAGAVTGWQHALRLEPLAGDARAFLLGTPGFRNGWWGAAEVPPLPIGVFAIAGALLWLAGWAMVPLGDAGSVRRRWGVAGTVAAGLVALAGVWQWDILRGARAAVIDGAAPVHRAPVLAAEVTGQALSGEVATVTGGQAAWTRVRLQDGRTGWIESRHVVLLQRER